ncbi:hypothetical protein [Breznakia pachnodae]|uniref:Uncharacterized protein n=1 Tax=Breznakia pachnodae TaxID=265178 RepID=A0ABU0E3R4_9FIRM|nr:hypothetical protein [Breznakia pachnodae]MDQ0361543.1 hypothetical protein [Breznakia pachnodae]
MKSKTYVVSEELMIVVRKWASSRSINISDEVTKFIHDFNMSNAKLNLANKYVLNSISDKINVSLYLDKRVIREIEELSKSLQLTISQVMMAVLYSILEKNQISKFTNGPITLLIEERIHYLFPVQNNNYLFIYKQRVVGYELYYLFLDETNKIIHFSNSSTNRSLEVRFADIGRSFINIIRADLINELSKYLLFDANDYSYYIYTNNNLSGDAYISEYSYENDTFIRNFSDYSDSKLYYPFLEYAFLLECKIDEFGYNKKLENAKKKYIDNKYLIEENKSIQEVINSILNFRYTLEDSDDEIKKEFIFKTVELINNIRVYISKLTVDQQKVLLDIVKDILSSKVLAMQKSNKLNTDDGRFAYYIGNISGYKETNFGNKYIEVFKRGVLNEDVVIDYLNDIINDIEHMQNDFVLRNLETILSNLYYYAKQVTSQQKEIWKIKIDILIEELSTKQKKLRLMQLEDNNIEK